MSIHDIISNFEISPLQVFSGVMTIVQFLTLTILGAIGLVIWRKQHLKTERYKAACKFTTLLYQLELKIFVARQPEFNSMFRTKPFNSIEEKLITNFNSIADAFIPLQTTFFEISPIIDNQKFNTCLNTLQKIVANHLTAMDELLNKQRYVNGLDDDIPPNLIKQATDLLEKDKKLFFHPQKSFMCMMSPNPATN